MADEYSNYNNIFNKKNIEFSLDGTQDRLPYSKIEEISLKANQIIFTSINNIFQKLLDNDLYNESLLKKYVEYGLIGGPTYVSSVSQVEENNVLNKKFVVSGENGISVLRKEEIDVADTLSGAFLSGTKVNKISFINERFVACTQNGIYESLDKYNWTRRIGSDRIDVLDIAFNQNFLGNNAVSAFDYVAVANDNRNTVFYGHSGIDNSWVSFSDSPDLSSIKIENVVPTSIFSFIDDPNLYVGTRTKGLMASELTSASDPFSPEIGTSRWTINDMVTLPNADEYENYMLATNYGAKQSQKEFGFRNLKTLATSNSYVYDALKDGNNIYIAMGEGLQRIHPNGEKTCVEDFNGKQCYSIAKAGGKLYIGTENGVYCISYGVVSHIGLESKQIKKMGGISGTVFVFDEVSSKILYSKNNAPFEEVPIDLEDGEYVKQFKTKGSTTIYAVTNKNVYAIGNGITEKVFLWCNSIAEHKNVSFAQNIDDGVLLRIDNALTLIGNRNITDDPIFEIAIDQSDTIGNGVKNTLKENSYFVLINNAIYEIFKNDEEEWVKEKVQFNDEDVLADKIILIDSSTLNGIAYISHSDKSIRFLSYNFDTLLFDDDKDISDGGTFRDLAVLNDKDIFGISGRKDIKRIGNIETKELEKVYDFENGVALIDTEVNYLSVEKDKITVNNKTHTGELTSTNVEAADIIDYLTNISGNSTLLVGANGSTKAYNIIQNSETKEIESFEEISLSVDVPNPNVFADLCYKNVLSNAINAVNFIGTDDGLLALSAIKKFLPHDIPANVVPINDVKNSSGTAYVASDSGIYFYDPSVNDRFVNTGFEKRAGSIVIRNINDTNILFASSTGEEILLSCNPAELIQWEDVFKGNTNQEFLVPPNPREPGTTIELTSNYGTVLNLNLKTISYLNENSGNASELDCLENPTELTSTNDVTPYTLSSIYKNQNNELYAVDIYRTTYRLTINGDGTFTASQVANMVPLSPDDILTSKFANTFEVSQNVVSVGYDDYTNTDGYYNDSSKIDVITASEEITANNEITAYAEDSLDLIAVDKQIIIDDWADYFNISCENSNLDIAVNFDNSVGIDSLKALLCIEFDAKVGIIKSKYELFESLDEEGHQITVDHEITIENPETGERITIEPPGILSSFELIYYTDEVLSSYVLSDTQTLDRNNNSFSISDIDNSLKSWVSSMNFVTDTPINYKAEIEISDIEYSPGYNQFNSSLNLSYQTYSLITYDEALNKKLPVLYESIDGIYYDNVFYVTEEQTPDQEIERKENKVYGYFIKLSNNNNEYLLFDGVKLIKFDGFNINTKHSLYGFVQIAKSLTQTFNDLYYFRVDKPFAKYPVRKTLISIHDKDFEVAKADRTSGTIEKVTSESTALYVKKGNSLYFTTIDTFPKFEEITFAGIPSGTDCIRDFISTKDATYIFLNEQAANRVMIYSNGGFTGSFYLNSETIANGVFENAFSNDDETILINTTTGIWKPYKDGNTWTTVLEDTFNERSDIRALIRRDDLDAIIGKDYLYETDLRYDFENFPYVPFGNITEKITDIKAVMNGSANPILYIATETAIYECVFNRFDLPALDYTINCISEGVAFNNINAIYFNQDYGELYIINGRDFYQYKYSAGTQLADLTPLVVSNFIKEPYDKITMTYFNNYAPIVVLNDTANRIAFASYLGIVDSYTYSENNNLSSFIYSNADDLYVFESAKLFQLTANESSFGLNQVGSGPNGTFKNTQIVIDNGSRIDAWRTSEGTATDVILQNGAKEISSYSVIGTNATGNMFNIRNTAYLGADNGIYSLGERTGYALDTSDEIYTTASELKENDVEFFALDFFNGNHSYLLNYLSTYHDTEDEVEDIPMSKFVSNNEETMNYLNANYISRIGSVALASLFNRYLFITDGNDGYVYDTRRKTGDKISLSQLEKANGGLASLMFLKDSSGLGVAGYGGAFCTFDGFGYVKIYDDVDNKKYIAISNNFKRGTQKIEVLNNKPDFLIGTTFGLKYVYDDIMTRSFYNREKDIAINSSVNVIEKVIDANNDEFFMIGENNSLYEVTGLKSAAFRKIHEFDPDETILDIFSLQKNEYIIATTKGIYTTALAYHLIDDLHRFTLDNIYEIINDELKKIIEDHINADHRPNSIITKVNAKADNKLLFVSPEDKHSDLYNATIANSVRVVKDDIIDTIVRGGETPDGDSYVKVGIKNWAVNSLNPVMTYTNDGFVNGFTDASTGKKFDISTVPYVVKNWKSGIKEIYIYVPSTGTYYINNPQGISNSQYSYNAYTRANVPNASPLNTLPNACTVLRVYLYNSYFKIKTILDAQCTGNSLPLKIYKDNANADDAWKGVFDTVIQPSALRTLPMTIDSNVNNVGNCTDDLERICIDFSIYGTDAQAIRIIAES